MTERTRIIKSIDSRSLWVPLHPHWVLKISSQDSSRKWNRTIDWEKWLIMGNSYFPTDPWVCCQAGLLCLDSVSTCSSTCHHVITGDDQTLRFIIFAQLCRPAGWTCFVSSCSLSAYVTDKPRHSGLSAGCITARSHKSWCIKREKKQRTADVQIGKQQVSGCTPVLVPACFAAPVEAFGDTEKKTAWMHEYFISFLILKSTLIKFNNVSVVLLYGRWLSRGYFWKTTSAFFSPSSASDSSWRVLLSFLISSCFSISSCSQWSPLSIPVNEMTYVEPLYGFVPFFSH